MNSVETPSPMLADVQSRVGRQSFSVNLHSLLSHCPKYRVVECPPEKEWLPIFGMHLKKDAIVDFCLDQYVPFDAATALLFKDAASGEWMNWYFPDQKPISELSRHLAPVIASRQ